MKRLALALALALCVLPIRLVHAQEIEPPDGTKINSAVVSGIDLDRLSPGLREEIGKLAGTPLNRQQLKDLATRLESEQPRYVAAIRAMQESDGGARVLFVVARLRDQDANVNARYIVEDVEINGTEERDLDQALRDDLHALAGKPLDSDEAERLSARLRSALPKYEISRRTVRGSQPGSIKLIYDIRRAEWARWLRFEPMDGGAVYHSDQGWGITLPMSMSSDDFHVTPIIAIDDNDLLIEEYSGFGIRLETRKLGTERLGALFEWSTYDQDWREQTLAAVAVGAQVPPLYRNRMNVTPLVKFAITPQISVGGGVSITELDSLIEPGPSQMANAAIGQVRYNQRWRPAAGASHNVAASFVARTGTRSLESDLIYERYLAGASYWFSQGNHDVVVSASAGHIDGSAPMFERFSLGDSRTLRGWDKYQISPAGADRMFSTTVEYRFHDVGMFLDSGSVWNDGTTRRARFSTGVTYNPGPVFFTLGFPLNTDEFHAVFTMGFRVSSFGWKRD
jgi:hypothetical protein